MPPIPLSFKGLHPYTQTLYTVKRFILKSNYPKQLELNKLCIYIYSLPQKSVTKSVHNVYVTHQISEKKMLFPIYRNVHHDMLLIPLLYIKLPNKNVVMRYILSLLVNLCFIFSKS
jgi:agmatine/peptidylarginine deiminase